MTEEIDRSAENLPANDLRLKLLQANTERLQHLAWEATVEQGRQHADIVLVCIEVDSIWRYVVDAIMPGREESWEAERMDGNIPNAVGTMRVEFCLEIADRFPELSDVLLEEPDEGCVKGLVLTHQRCMIIDVEPKSDMSKLQ